MFETSSIHALMNQRKINLKIFQIIDKLKKVGIPLDLESGPWVAGGCLTKAMINEELSDSDIDIFVPSRKAFDIVKKTIHYDARFKIIDESAMAVSYHFSYEKDEICKIQIIKERTAFSSKYSLLGHFDFSIVKIVTDGESVLYHKDFFKDLDQRRLVIDAYGLNDSAMTERVIKYTLRGFKLDPYSAMRIIDHNQSCTTGSLYR